MNRKKTTPIKAGEAFLEKFPDHPLIKLCEDPGSQTAVRADSRAVAAMLAEVQADMEAKLEPLAAEAKTAHAEFCAQWEKRYGERYPDDYNDWLKWLARLGMPGHVLVEAIAEGKWTYDPEILSLIKGHLRRLQDKQKPVASGKDNSPCIKGLRQSEVAKGMGKNRGVVSRMVSNGDLGTNGKTGRDCRITPDSVVKYCKEKGITWNES